MNDQRLPVLHQDGSRLDWVAASYDVDVQHRGSEARIIVDHALKEASALDRLVDEGFCSWATEIRCPRTLFSQVFLSNNSHQEVTWEPESTIWENTYLICGVVATRSARLVSEGLNELIWPGGTALDIPQGWWLALSEMMQLNPLLNSLLVFRSDPDLPDGQMSVEEDTSSSDPRFTVWLAEDIHSEIKSRRDVQIAGLIGAFSCMPNSTMQREGERADHPVAEELRRRLWAFDLKDWDDPELFDPALAATTIERFHTLALTSVPDNADEDEEDV